jgi:hypothetical protein
MPNKRGFLAVSQIIILLVGIVAFTVLINGGIVSALDISYEGTSGVKKGTYSPSKTSPVSKSISGGTYYKRTGGEGATYLVKDSTGGWNYWQDGEWNKYNSYSQTTFNIKTTAGNHKLGEITTQYKPQTTIPADSSLEVPENPKFEPEVLGKGESESVSNPSSPGGEALPPTQDYPYAGKWYGGPFLGHITEGLWYSMIVLGVIQMLGPMFTDNDEMISALSKSSFGGIMAGKGTLGLLTKYEKGWASWLKDYPKLSKITHGQISLGVGVLVAALIFYNTYKSESTETITFECDPWDAPTGGENCEKCNQQGSLPCSEYQCRSLGQSCELLNPGTDEEKCVWVNRKDVEFPIITPWEDALLEDYKYNPDNTISPPDRGVKIVNRDSTTGCAKAFTPLTFGITTNEPAKCKIDFLRKDSFDEMNYYFGASSLLRYNHTQIMSLPGPDNLESENLTIQNDGSYELYVRCQDANGNHNTANFVFKFCVEKGPDTTPPLIVATNLLNGMPIAYNTSFIDLEVYVNEPANCRWSRTDQSYNKMEESMTCSSSIFEMNAQMLYKCSTKLTSLKNNEENKFYFRCEDKPLDSQDRNVNSESYEFSLIGTQPLVISDIEPNETIKDSTDVVKVVLEAETSAGYKEGEATCYYSETGKDNDYVMFFYENANNLNYKHSQDLYLEEGDYEYFIKCIDLGGNSDVESTQFRVESDSSAPIIVRAYHEESYLKLITNEEAECVYGTDTCNYLFDDGIKMTSVENKNKEDVEHYTDWSTKKNFYVKCKDEYGNQPLPNDCSIIVRPVKIYIGE